MTTPSLRHAAVIFGAACLAVCVIAGVALFASAELSRRALQGVEQQAQRFIGGAQAALNRAVLGVDVLVAGVGELAPEPGELGSAEGRSRAARLMEIGVTQNPLVRKVVLLSAAGDVLVSSEERGRGDSGRMRLPDGYLASVLGQTVPALVISDVAVSRSTARPVVFLGRALRLGDDSRAVAVAEVDLGLLMGLLIQGADIKGLEVTLEREGGVLLASVPSYVAPRAEGMGAPRAVAAGRAARASPSPARLTGAPAIVVERASLQPGLRVTASIPLALAMADWRRERDIIAGLAALLIGLTVAGAVYLHLRVRRQWLARAELLRSRATLDQALESMQVGFVLLDPEDRILVWNRNFLEIFPWARTLTRPLAPFAPIFERAAAYRRPVGAGDWSTWRSGGQDPQASVPLESELELPDGRVIRSTKNRTPDGGLVCIYQDITEKRLHTAAILESRAQLQATLDALPDTLLELDGDGRCHRVHSPQGLVASDVARPGGASSVQALLPPVAAAAVMHAVSEARRKGVSRGHHTELPALPAARHIEISVSRKARQGGGPEGFIAILRDVTQAQQATREIRQLAFYDVLTGLPNRRYLLDLMTSGIEVDPSSGRYGAVLFLDLDNFKTLNDALGHAIGDALLKEVATRISRSVPPAGVVARLGGDEFVVLLEGLGPGSEAAGLQAREVGERIIDALNVPFSFDTQTTYQRTCSVGVAIFDGQERSLDELLKQADIAMYVAKTSGGNCLRFFAPEMQAAVAARSALENEIREALTAREFELHYQGQVDRGGAVVGAEALVRWRHPRRGLLQPGEFISVAEDSDLMVALGRQVLEMACAQLARWRHRPGLQRLQIAVNVSARQFRRDDFADDVQRVLAAAGADPCMLKLELTESLLQSQVQETIRKMHQLRRIGVRFSMDDFGTGYSSLSYLTQLPLDQVKIDKYFVSQIGRDSKFETIVQTIIGMARNLDVELIAEGVETVEQLQFLRDNGCLFYQGYLFSMPAPIAAFERSLEEPSPA